MKTPHSIYIEEELWRAIKEDAREIKRSPSFILSKYLEEIYKENKKSK